VILVFIFSAIKRTENGGWSLSSAISEIVAFKSDGTIVYVSSVSRFIALLGCILILWIYTGLALEILLHGGVTPPQIKDDEFFLFWGLALFAPYVANQARAAIVGMGKGIPGSGGNPALPVTGAPEAQG